MTALTLLSAAASAAASTSGAAPAHLNPVKLFLDADIVVQAIMAGLLLASVWVWTIVVSFSLRMNYVRRSCRAYEAGFWQAKDMGVYHAGTDGKAPIGRVVGAALAEWRRGHSLKQLDREGMRQRLEAVMAAVVEQEADRLGDRLNFLATVGSAAPFIGLFGTVWGIMNSFFQIGQQQNSSLAVVAPGISEALFATAIGLFAAIPAVIAYNRFSHSVNTFEGSLQRFADRFHATLSRELEVA